MERMSSAADRFRDAWLRDWNGELLKRTSSSGTSADRLEK